MVKNSGTECSLQVWRIIVVNMQVQVKIKANFWKRPKGFAKVTKVTINFGICIANHHTGKKVRLQLDLKFFFKVVCKIETRKWIELSVVLETRQQHSLYYEAAQNLLSQKLRYQD